MKTNKNDSAFTRPYNLNSGAAAQDGITKLEYFAGHALQGILASTSGDFDSRDFARAALMCAEALIAELNEVSDET